MKEMIEIDLGREQLDQVLQGQAPGFASIIGACAMHDTPTMFSEGLTIARYSTPSRMILQRNCFWKPRTPRADGSKPWEGLETTDSEAVLRRLEQLAQNEVPIAAEVGKPEHVQKYSDLLTFAWIGARSIEDSKLVEQ